MSAGKKGKKKKCKTVDLMSFLADGDGTPTVPLKTTSWADDVEEDHDGFSSRASRKPVVLPTAPRATRHIDDSDVPSKPPYVAYLTNLPYEVDEEDLVKFFADLKIASMRLPKDTNILKGSGYVEFEDRESLIDALCKSNTQMKTRRVRIEVSNSTNDDRRGGRMGRNNRRDTYNDPERTSGDWRSGPRDEQGGSDGDSHRGSRYENRDRREEREPSEYDNKPGGWRDSGDRGRPSLRDRGDSRAFRSDDRERDGGREWSRYGGDRGSRDRDGGDRDRGTSFGPRRNYGDSDWDRDGPRQDRDRMDKPSEPRTRPKLQLQPRTKPVEPIVVQDEPEPAADAPTAAAQPPAPAPAPTAAPVPAANIFGAAKPVDTTAREREIEERLTKTYADARPKEDGEEKRKEGTWGRRNGEGRDERDKERGRPTWRSEDDRGRRPRSSPRDQDARSDHSETRGQPPSRGPPPAASRAPQKSIDTRAAPERERKDRDDITRMPKAKDEEPPNFVASNKYSMLPDEEEEDEEEEEEENPDNIDD